MSEKKTEQASIAQEIESLRRRRLEIEKRHEDDTERLEQDINAIKKRVLDGGETSGDRITDYLLAAYGYIDHEISLPFRRIEEQLAGKTGQFFLVVKRSRKQHSFRGCFGGEGPRESDYHLETSYSLGILSGDKLIFDAKRGECRLPTEGHAELSFNGPPVTKPGPFPLVERWFSGLGKLVHAGRDSGAEIEVLIGCEAVFAYAPPDSSVGLGKRPAYWVIALNRAVRALGRNIPEAPEEAAARVEEQIKILNRLNQERDHLGVLREHNTKRTELEKCKDELRSLLVRAKELGLEDKPLVKLIESEL